MILIIDNYDSFTYNIVQALGEIIPEIEVRRNDCVSLREAVEMAPDFLVISPGPGNPGDSGISNGMIQHFSGKIPILGICLGEQCIAHTFGGKVVHAPSLVHGKSTPVYHDGKGIYRNLPNPIEAGRYHSLIVEEESLPECCEISAYTVYGEIMGIRHRDFPVEGVQFHPESILTGSGGMIFRNFLKLGGRDDSVCA